LNGNINLWLPRSFRGFLTSSTHAGETSFSETVSEGGHLIEKGSTTKIFVGDYINDTDDLEFDQDAADAAAPEWKGDTVALKTLRGQVQVRFVDESARSPLGLLGRGIDLSRGGEHRAGGAPAWLPPVLHPLFLLTAAGRVLNVLRARQGGPRTFARPERPGAGGLPGRWR
jgi:hypothetical protein